MLRLPIRFWLQLHIDTEGLATEQFLFRRALFSIDAQRPLLDPLLQSSPGEISEQISGNLIQTPTAEVGRYCGGQLDFLAAVIFTFGLVHLGRSVVKYLASSTCESTPLISGNFT